MSCDDDQILDAMRLKTSSLRSLPICYHSSAFLQPRLIYGTSYCSVSVWLMVCFWSSAGHPLHPRVLCSLLSVRRSEGGLMPPFESVIDSRKDGFLTFTVSVCEERAEFA